MRRIIHIGNVFGDTETLDKTLEFIAKSGADILAVTGDLAGPVFDDKIVDTSGKTQLRKYQESFNILYQVLPQVAQETQGQVITLHNLADYLQVYKLL